MYIAIDKYGKKFEVLIMYITERYLMIEESFFILISFPAYHIWPSLIHVVNTTVQCIDRLGKYSQKVF